MPSAFATTEKAPSRFPQIDTASAWTSAELGGAEALTHRLSAPQKTAMRALAQAIGDRDVETIGRDDAADPEITALMRAVKFELSRGKGAIILSGLETEGLSEDQYAHLFWALGTHLGDGVVQSAKRDLIGRVEKSEDNPAQRGYQLDIELGSHCDFHEILGLACYRKADRGGESGLASSLAIHNEMARMRPDLLEALYRGFPHQCATPEDRSTHDVPVFCNVDGVVSCYYHRLFFLNAARDTSTPLPPDLREAMDLFDQLGRRDDLRATFLMQPGEMVFWQNFVILHSRESFIDRPDHRRLLFRLWLHARPGEGRAMTPDFVERARVIDSAHQQGRPGIIYQLEGAA